MGIAKKFSILVVAALIGTSSLSGYGAETVPPNLQAVIFFKVLTFDKNLPARSPNGVLIGIVVDSATAGQKGALVGGFSSLKGQKAQGKSVDVVVIDFSDKNQLEASVKEKGINMLYVPAGAKDGTVDGVKAVAAGSKIPSLGGSEDLAQKGLAVGLALEGGKPKLVVNLSACKSQSMNLGAQVLQLAKVL